MSKITQRSDGRYVKTITDQRTGKKLFFYGKTKKEINQKILEYSKEREEGKSFCKVAEEWYDTIEPKLAYQSRESYRVALRRACEEFKDTSIKQIKPKDINVYIFKLLNKNFAQKTISNHKMVLNQIFDFAILQDEIEYNPCSSTKIPKNAKKNPRKSASPEEEKIILNSADKWLFPYIAMLTGMRKGEILALQWKDIDFEKNIIKVTKSIYYEGNNPKIKEPKTEAGQRIVPLLEDLKKTLIEIPNKKPNDFIISDEDGKPISKKSFRWRYAKFQKETGITCTAHQIRHSFATNAFESNVAPKSIQEILGHKQLATTMDIYTDFRKKSFDSAALLLNENFKNKK